MFQVQIFGDIKISIFDQVSSRNKNISTLVSFLKSRNMPSSSASTISRKLKSNPEENWVTVNFRKKDGGHPAYKFRKTKDITKVKPLDISKFLVQIKSNKVLTKKIEGMEFIFSFDDLFKPIREIPNLVLLVLDRIPKPDIEIVSKGFTAVYRLIFTFLTAEGELREVSTRFTTNKTEQVQEMIQLFSKIIHGYSDDFFLTGMRGILRYFKSRPSQMGVGHITVKSMREQLRMMRHNRHYNGKYSKFLEIKKNKVLYCPSSFKACFLKSYIVSNNPWISNKKNAKGASSLASTVTRFREELGFPPKRYSIDLLEYIEAIKRLEPAPQSAKWKKHPPNMRFYPMTGDMEYFDMGHPTDRCLEFLMIGGHACALFPKEDPYLKWETDLSSSRKYCSLIGLKNIREVKKKSESMGHTPEEYNIYKREQLHKITTTTFLPFEKSTIAWDAETKTNENNKLFLINAVGEFCGKWNTGVHNTPNQCIAKFLQWVKFVASSLPENKMLFLYSHNGGKFDNHYPFKFLMNYPNGIEINDIEELEKLYAPTIGCKFGNNLNQPSAPFIKGGRFIKFDTYYNGHKISFRDSLPLLPGSLAGLTGTRGFDVEHKKKVGDVDMKLFRDDILNSRPDICERIIEYCDWDAMGLYEVLMKYHDILREKYQLDFRRKFTAASISKLIFLEKYYDPYTYPIYTLSDEIDLFIRKGFAGGRTDCYTHLGEQNSGNGEMYYYYDATSFYPTVMSQDELPYGRPRLIENHFKIEEAIVSPHYNGFVECWIKSRKSIKIPLHAYKMKVNGTYKLIFPHFENWTLVNLYSKEIIAGLNYGLYSYDFVKAYFFKSSFHLKKFTDDLFELKKMNAFNPAAKQVWKTSLNSGYGFWGINRYTKSYKICSNTNDIYTHLATGTLRNVSQYKNAWVIEQDSFMSKVESNVAIAAAITSGARLRLWKMMMEIENIDYRNGEDFDDQKTGIVYYSDTDSIISTLDMENEPYFKKKYFSNPGCLGDWANEISQISDKRGSDFLVTIGPKVYAIEGFVKLKGYAVLEGEINIDHENKEIIVTRAENIPDDELIAKCLAVENVERHKAKLNKDALALVAQGYVIKQRNARTFQGSTSSQLFDTKIQQSDETIIPVKYLNEKKFVMNYNKQNIDENGNLSPLEISGDQELYALYEAKIRNEYLIGEPENWDEYLQQIMEDDERFNEINEEKSESVSF